MHTVMLAGLTGTVTTQWRGECASNNPACEDQSVCSAENYNYCYICRLDIKPPKHPVLEPARLRAMGLWKQRGDNDVRACLHPLCTKSMYATCWTWWHPLLLHHAAFNGQVGHPMAGHVIWTLRWYPRQPLAAVHSPQPRGCTWWCWELGGSSMWWCACQHRH